MSIILTSDILLFYFHPPRTMKAKIQMDCYVFLFAVCA